MLYGNIVQIKDSKIISNIIETPSAEIIKIQKDQPIYLIYSFTKTDGILNKIGRKYILNKDC